MFKGVNVRYRTKFRGDRSNHCWDMAISRLDSYCLLSLKTSQFKTVCKDDSVYDIQLKQQKLKEIDIT